MGRNLKRWLGEVNTCVCLCCTGPMTISEAGGAPAQGAPPLGRRERKRQQVRDQLYGAAVGLFVAQGYEATTMEQIAESADVARATVFNHFSQKVGFLEEWGVRRRARVAAILGQEHAEDLPVGDRLRRYLGEMADLNVASRAETTVLMDASARFGRLLQDPPWKPNSRRSSRRGGSAERSGRRSIPTRPAPCSRPATSPRSCAGFARSRRRSTCPAALMGRSTSSCWASSRTRDRRGGAEGRGSAAEASWRLTRRRCGRRRPADDGGGGLARFAAGPAAPSSRPGDRQT